MDETFLSRVYNRPIKIYSVGLNKFDIYCLTFFYSVNVVKLGIQYCQIHIPYFREQFPWKLFFFEIGSVYCDCAETIQGRKLFAEIQYVSKEVGGQFFLPPRGQRVGSAPYVHESPGQVGRWSKQDKNWSTQFLNNPLGTIHKRRLPKGGGRGVQKMPKKETFTSRFEETRGGRVPQKSKIWGDVVYGWSLIQRDQNNSHRSFLKRINLKNLNNSQMVALFTICFKYY